MSRPAIEKCSADLSADASNGGTDSHLMNVATFSDAPPKKFAGLTASAGEVSAALGLTEKAFRRKMRVMHRDLGFPLPLRGGNWTWSTRAVRIWIEATGDTTPAHETAAIGDDIEEDDEAITRPIVLAQRRDLRRRYGARA